MKYIFFLVLVCTSYFSFSQMTVSEIIRVYKMNIDQFEKYAIGNHFVLDESNKDSTEVDYKIIQDTVKRYLYYFNHSEKRGKLISYRTSSRHEYIKFENELKTLGFKKVFESNIRVTQKYKTYKNKNLEIKTYASNWSDSIYGLSICRIGN